MAASRIGSHSHNVPLLHLSRNSIPEDKDRQFVLSYFLATDMSVSLSLLFIILVSLGASISAKLKLSNQIPRVETLWHTMAPVDFFIGAVIDGRSQQSSGFPTGFIGDLTEEHLYKALVCSPEVHVVHVLIISSSLSIKLQIGCICWL